jgi:hypothetical protein
VVGVLTGRCHLEGYLFKLGLTNIPIYERCIEKEEPATLWGISLPKISSLGSLFHGTKRLPWQPHKESPTLH